MATPLPPPPRQLWLLEQLDALQAEHGRERLVNAPLAVAGAISDRNQDADGLAGAVAGLMQHVGLGQLKVELRVQAPGLLPGQEGTATAYRHHGTWFTGAWPTISTGLAASHPSSSSGGVRAQGTQRSTAQGGGTRRRPPEQG